MGHLLKINTHILQMSQVRILASTAVPFRLTMVQMTKLALVEAKLIAVRPGTAETFKFQNLKNNFYEPRKRNGKKKYASHAPSCISGRLFL
jgi:hypothetical protein